MTLDWPVAVIIVAALAAVVTLARPYVIGRTADKAREKALGDMNARLDRVEASIISNTRKIPGRL